MEIRLKPEHEAIVEQAVAAGRYESAEAYLTEAISFLHEREQWRSEALDEELAKLDASIAEAERGELIDEDEVRRRLRALKVKVSLPQSA